MADTQTVPVSLLMGLPLEVRHNIFEYTAARDMKPKKLLRQWFEKKEVKELIAKEVASNPTRPTPQVVYVNEYEEDSDVPEPEEEEAEGQDSDDEDGEAQNGEDDQDNEDEDEDNEDDEADQDQDQDNEAEMEEAENEDEDAMEEDQDTLTQDIVQPPTTVQAQPLPTTTTQATIPAQSQTVNQAKPADEAAMDTDEPLEAENTGTDAVDAQDEVVEDGDQSMAGNDGEEDGQDGEEEDGEDGANAADNSNPPPLPPPAPISVHASRKWRYIPNFMRITHCPPPAELLLTSKQLNHEAKNWFYDVAILRISATNSFAHTSFFEEAFSQITEAAFSPMENVRKVEVMFVWDTTWLRADQAGFAEAIFPALLRQRADFVHQILSRAPDLKEVTIHWHDSARDDESASFMLDILAPFHELNATVKIEEHYIAADAKPHKRSIAGKQRVQFQQIVDAGLERLF